MALQDSTGAHIAIMGGGTPTLAAGANAGSSPPAPVLGTGATDARGRCTFGTGSSPALGQQVAVTFAVPYSVTPTVIVTAENNATALLNPGVSSVNAQGFNFNLGTVPAASQAATVYAFAWEVLG